MFYYEQYICTWRFLSFVRDDLCCQFYDSAEQIICPLIFSNMFLFPFINNKIVVLIWHSSGVTCCWMIFPINFVNSLIRFAASVFSLRCSLVLNFSCFWTCLLLTHSVECHPQILFFRSLVLFYFVFFYSFLSDMWYLFVHLLNYFLTVSRNSPSG